MKTYYLDCNAHTPLILSKKELSKILDLPGVHGNPKTINGLGITSSNLVEKCREGISELLGCEPQNIIFCNSCTQANQWMSTIIDNIKMSTIVNKSPYEHSSLDCLDCSCFTLDKDCNITDNINDIISCFIGVHNETGVISDFSYLRNISKIYCSDLCQAISKIDLSLNLFDIATFGGHKFGGPNIGVLYSKELYTEFGYGSRYNLDITGSPDVFSIVCLYESLKKSLNTLIERQQKAKEFQKTLEIGLKNLGYRVINENCDRSPFVSFVHTDKAIDIMNYLSEHNIFCGLGSACISNAIDENSKTMKALGEDINVGCLLRFSQYGNYTEKDAKYIIQILNNQNL